MADIVYPGQLAGQLQQLPANYDLSLYKGDYFQTSVVLKDNSGSPINLSGYTAKCSIKSGYSAVDGWNATCTITAVDGRVDIMFPSSVMETIDAGDYIWDFQVTNPGGNVRTYLTGDVKIWDEVTT